MPTDEQGQQPTPQAQPQAQSVADPAHDILSAVQTDDKTKADAWEVYHNHEGKEFEDKLSATSLPQDVKSKLWQAKTSAAKQPKDTGTGVDLGVVSGINSGKEFVQGAASSLGLPSSMEELKASKEEHDIVKHPVSNIAQAVGGPALGFGESLYGSAKRLGQGIVSTGKEAYEAGQNIAEGQPVLQQLAKPASEALNTAVGSIPFIGAPMEQAGKDIVAGKKARAAGELAGVIGQVAIPELHEKIAPDATLKFHESKVADAQKALDTAKKSSKVENYADSAAQGITPPKKVQGPIDKAQEALDEAVLHRDLYKEAEAKRRAEATAKKPAPTPEIPTEQVEAAPLTKLGKKTTTPPTVSPAHSTTTIPQEPTPAPRPSYGRIALPNEQGTMGTPKLLTEGTPEGPKVPEGGLPKINLPEEKPAPKPVTDESSLRALEAKKGVVTENTPKKLHELLKESLKPAEKYAGEERREVPRQAPKSAAEVEEAIKNRKPIQTPFDVTQGAMETIKGDKMMPKTPAEETAETAKEKPVLPKEEPTGYTPKKEEVVGAGEEGREPAKSAAEYHPAVQQKVSELSDEKLRTLAKAHGLNPDEYDFKARDEGRHRVERDRLAKEITEQMGDDEKINLGRAAEQTDKEGLFQGADTSAKGRSERAAKMFPRLRGPVDDFGNPKVSGGAPDTVGTAEAAKSDTEHFSNAKKELGDKASISDVAKRAQELKDAAAKPKFDMIKDADGKPDRLEITHKGEPKGHLKIEEQIPGTWTIKDAAVKPGEQRQGLGKAALEQTLDEAKQAGAKVVESDVSQTSKAKGMWDAVQRNHPDAVTEENGQYSVNLAKLGKKSQYGKLR